MTSLLTANGRLLYRPTIDPRGYTRIVHTTRPGVMRSDAVTGAQADLVDLQAML